MPETSREITVVLLDETTFSVPVKATLLTIELLDMAASHCKVKEREYFGLYLEVDGYKNWLEVDKPVLDPCQDIPKGTHSVKVFFAFKFFVNDIHSFQDYITVELMYLCSRQAIMKGEILTEDDETIFELAACVLQAQHGDYKSEAEALQYLKHLPVIPANVFKNSSVQLCESKVVAYYKMLRCSRGEAVLRYLEIIQTLAMYSIHYFSVKDKKDKPLWLGVGPDGICTCPATNFNETEARYQWLQLQNIYYRDKKFSMEVYQPPKQGSKKSVGFGPVNVLAWYGINTKVVMAIWKMARDQHMFYRTRRSTRAAQGMSGSEIIQRLSRLHHANLSPSSSQSSLSIESAKSNHTQASAEALAAAKAAQNEMYSALMAKRTALQQEFQQKLLRYKDILIKEMQITGIPPEGLTGEEIERMRKKFGVSFKFSKFVLDKGAVDGGGAEEDLQRQLEIQMSIIEASKNLLSQSQGRRMKKERKKEIKAAEGKMAKLEERLHEMRRTRQGSGPSASKFNVDTPPSTYISPQAPGSTPTSRRISAARSSGGSIDDSYLATIIFDSPSVKPSSSSSLTTPSLSKSPLHKSTSALNDLHHQAAGLPSAVCPPSTPRSIANAPAPLQPKTSVSSLQSDKSFTLDYSHSASYLSGFADDYDTSPPSSVVSAANMSAVSQGVRRDDHSLRDFNLTDDFLQHFTREGTGAHVTSSPLKPSHPPPQTHLSPRQPNTDPGYNYPSASSPVMRPKRSSSPCLIYPPESHGVGRVTPPGPPGYHHRTSPDPHQYSASYHPPSILNRNPNYPSVNLTPPRGHPPGQSSPHVAHRGSPAGTRQHAGQPNSQWYNNSEFAEHGGYANRDVPVPMNRSSSGSRLPSTGATRTGDEVHLEDMLKTWQESSTNPFGEGTLV